MLLVYRVRICVRVYCICLLSSRALVIQCLHWFIEIRWRFPFSVWFFSFSFSLYTVSCHPMPTIRMWMQMWFFSSPIECYYRQQTHWVWDWACVSLQQKIQLSRHSPLSCCLFSACLSCSKIVYLKIISMWNIFARKKISDTYTQYGLCLDWDVRAKHMATFIMAILLTLWSWYNVCTY